ncbi:hypothetical protein ACSQ67_017487 [Phaseolus vulgaris]
MKIFWFLQCLFCMAMLLISPSVAPNAPAPPSSGDLKVPETPPNCHARSLVHAHEEFPDQLIYKVWFFYM